MDDYIDMEGSNTAVERKTCSQQLDLPSATNSPINNHKILQDISSLGCKQKALNAAAYRTFLDLCEVRKCEKVSYHYHKELDLVYLKASKKLGDAQETIIPVLACKKISFESIEKLQDTFESDCIKVAICDSNALVMYYKLTRS